jgi:glycosyltransferase involved in cell wall biosynthesis
MRFHVLGLAHTVSTKEYSQCAFTQKIVNMCRMLSEHGYDVFHYGHADSEIMGVNVPCINNGDQRLCYGDHDWRVRGFPHFEINDGAWNQFNMQAIQEIERRKCPGDFLLIPFGYAQRKIAKAHEHDMKVVESGIGYGGGFFAPYKVFESYALLHAYLGLNLVTTAFNDHWYDVVIPNYYDPDDFTYRLKKDDYLFHMGRLGIGKGSHIAIDLARRTGRCLLLAGPPQEGFDIPTDRDIHYIGVVGPEERRNIMASAAAVLCPSTYLEPFCGTQVEAFLSGTPVISTDFGAFAEVNLHGHTGWRCRNMGEFVRAVGNLDQIKPQDCRRHGLTYSLDKVWPLYQDYFETVARDDWYAGA